MSLVLAGVELAVYTFEADTRGIVSHAPFAKGRKAGGEAAGGDGDGGGGDGDGDSDDDDDDGDDGEDGEAAKAPKRRRLVVESDEDEDDESDEAGGEALLIPQYDGAGSEEEDDDDDDVGEEEAEDSEDDSLPNSGDHEVSRKDFCDEMNLVVAHAPCDPNDDDDDHEERIHRQCCLAFECSDDNDHVPKVILQFQSGDFDLWEPESSWVGEHGRRTAGIWAILDSLRWG